MKPPRLLVIDPKDDVAVALTELAPGEKIPLVRPCSGLCRYVPGNG